MKKPRRQRIRNALLRLTIAYLAICALLFFMERRILYQPFPGPTTPEAVGLAGYSLERFTTNDGLQMPYWWHSTASGPIVLYFHGNGGGLYGFKPALAYLAEQGFAVAAMEYRGYPNAPGKPSERALIADAVAFYDATHALYPDRPIVIWGYSLGSGVAVQVAAQRAVIGLVLEAPFSATVDVAKRMYPVIPVGWLMRDQFLSRETIGHVHAPVFIMHGENDTVIPMHFGKQLYARANDPKQFHHYPQTGHMDLIRTPAYSEAVKFIKDLKD